MQLIFSIIILLILSSYSIVYAQLGSRGIPISYGHKIPDSAIITDLPINHSEIFYLTQKTQTRYKKEEYIAINKEIYITPTTHGIWQQSIGLYFWLLSIEADEAKTLALIFENIQLYPGEKLYVYNQNDILGAFTHNSIPKSKVLSTVPLKGSKLNIEFSTPYDQNKRGTFAITSLLYGIKEMLNEEDPCNVNISCSEDLGWQQVKRSVVKLIVNKYNGTILCSGTLLNNSKADARPLLITANHCVDNEYNAERTNYIFNYESPTCSSNYSLQIHSLSGSKLLATKYENDFSLLELDAHPPISYRPYYAGWSIDTGSNMNQIVAIHHPNGKVKKITGAYKHPTTDTYFEPGEPPYAPNAFWLIDEYVYGITENGSSGCGLFDINHQLVGTLTGGNSSNPVICNRDLFDFYQKFSSSFLTSPNYGQPLNTFLNPDNLSINNLSGYDPFPTPYSSCDTSYNISDYEVSNTEFFEFGQGYYVGHNSENIELFAEKFVNNDSLYLYGIEFNIQQCGTRGGLAIQIYEGDDKPQNLIDEQFVSLTKLIPYSSNYVEFYPYVNLKGNYFVAIKLFYDSDTVNFAVVKRTIEPYNSAYLWVNNNWIPFNEYTLGNWRASIDLKTMFCNSVTNDSKPITNNSIVEIFPNPSKGYFYIKMNHNEIKNIQIFNLEGKIININLTQRNALYTINLLNYPSGIYLIRMITITNDILIKKLIKL